MATLFLFCLMKLLCVLIFFLIRALFISTTYGFCNQRRPGRPPNSTGRFFRACSQTCSSRRAHHASLRVCATLFLFDGVAAVLVLWRAVRLTALGPQRPGAKPRLRPRGNSAMLCFDIALWNNY